MNAEELLVHHCRQRQTAERLHASFVNGLRILVLAFQLEGEVIGQMTALVVSTKKPECLRIVDLEGPKVQHTLDTEVSAVDVVAQEEIPRLCGVATNLKQLHQVVVLAVDIAAHGNWRVHLEKVWLCPQKLGALFENP